VAIPRSTAAPLLRWIACALAAALLSACGGAQSRYASHMARGKEYLAQGRLDKAGIEFRNALQIEPKAADALYFNGQVLERLGNIRGAFGAYQAAIDIQSDLPSARASLASIYLVGGLPKQALAILKPGLAKHPDSAELLVVRAAARSALNDSGGARADAERTLKLDPTNARAVGLLAGMDREMGDFPAAIALVTDAVGRTPSSIELREVLASLYFDAKRPVDGVRQLRQLIELKPLELRYRYELAVRLAQGHDTDAAQRALEDAVRAVPDNDQAKLILTDFISSERSPAEAEKTLRGFIARAPDHYGLRLGLGALLERRGATPEALETYEEIVRLERERPAGLAARDRIAQIDASHGHADAALRMIAEVLRDNPRDGDALTLRGTIEAERNDSAGAIADLRAVLRDQPNATAVRSTLARVYLANGQPGLAEESLRAALDAAPRDIAVRIELAEVLAGTQRAEQAVTLLEETVKLAPSDPRAREALARAYLAQKDLVAARRAADALEVLQPKAAIGYYLTGLVARADGRTEESEAAFERALALQPGALDALVALTQLEVSHGEGARAITQAQSLLAREPKNPLILNLLGELYAATGDAARAEQTQAQATELAPHWALPYHDLAALKLASHDAAGAIAEYEAGLKAAPNNPELATELAALYEREGRTEDAIARLDALCRADPRQKTIASDLAMLLVTYRSDARSLDRARDLTASFVTAEDPHLLDSYGWVRFKRDEYSDAVAALNRAVQRAPGVREIRYHLAMAELRLGQRDRARTDLETALAGGSARFVGADDARSILASLQGRGAG
jgi:tetratricopeptide (TPR) repeat protein